MARAQGFTDDRSTDPVPFGQGRFGRETLSDCQIAGGYCGTKVCEDCLAALTRAATGRLVAQLSDRFMPSLLRLPKSRVKHRTR